MRYLSLFALLLIACNNGTQPTYQYDSMLFKREGGGNLEFTVTRGVSSFNFQVSLSRISFRDTSIGFVLTKSLDNATAFDSLSRALNGQIDVTGTFQRDTAAIVGTWAFVYMIKETASVEVTNIALRNTLLKFENFVNDSL